MYEKIKYYFLSYISHEISTVSLLKQLELSYLIVDEDIIIVLTNTDNVFKLILSGNRITHTISYSTNEEISLYDLIYEALS